MSRDGIMLIVSSRRVSSLDSFSRDLSNESTIRDCSWRSFGWLNLSHVIRDPPNKKSIPERINWILFILWEYKSLESTSANCGSWFSSKLWNSKFHRTRNFQEAPIASWSVFSISRTEVRQCFIIKITSESDSIPLDFP